MHIKNIMITGASRGIGFEASKALIDKGHKVIATARSSDALDTLRSYSPDRIKVISADLSTLTDVELLSDFLDENDIYLDGLIHNAGLLINKPFPDLTDSDWQRMISVNFMAPVRTTKQLLGHFNDGSHILNISSMGGYQHSTKFAGLSGYSATKGALGILTECMATELAGRNIKANCLCLGAVQTEMLEEAFPGMKAPVEAADMGNYIADFVLQAHRFYNGQILPVALSDPSQ